jgi:cold shock CspA family protein
MSSSSDARMIGMVKWFNTKSGFGFITVLSEGDLNGKDIFAHYTSLRVTNSQYKYLTQGEYVEFMLIKSTNESHEVNASDVSGMLGGPLMCETHRAQAASQASRSVYPGQEGFDERTPRPRSPMYRPRPDSSRGPRVSRIPAPVATA